MSWEQEDLLRRKVRETRERRAFRNNIETVLSAKDAQGAVLTQREAEQARRRQPTPDLERQRAGVESQKTNSRIIRHVRDGRSEQEP